MYDITSSIDLGSKVSGTSEPLYTLLVGKLSFLLKAINPTYPRHTDDATSFFLSCLFEMLCLSSFSPVFFCFS
ncbi:hypothetical protein KFK09_009110 [Dendrobium nobile]|uniref:Uncharacterized protein n=1 Tax=Dendrobium nobile TaxID=94219 RepID=A0A8T3BQ25_DENNO|nr:hypothetical protein KFK09_009110 [Dendrobium nobile]